MAVKVSPLGPKPQFEDQNGNPMTGAKLYFYAAGSSTKQNTYTNSVGNVANSNPITLDARGEPTTTEIWFTEGQTYKILLTTDTVNDPPQSSVWSVDNVSGQNDTTGLFDEWVAGDTPTFISATSFSVAGDKTSTYHKGRRLKSTNTAGTVYSTVVSSAYSSVTTVTVASDGSSVLDSGLSAVLVSLVKADNPSVSPWMVNRKGTAVASAATTDIWSGGGDFIHVTGSTGPITSFGTAPYAGARMEVIFDSTPTITHNATTLVLPGAQNITMAANDRIVVRADTTANMVVTHVERASGKSLNRLPRSYLSGLGISNGTDATNDFNIAVGECRDKDNTIDMVLSSELGKQLDTAWAVGGTTGTPLGMLATGAAVTNTTYHIFLIHRPDTGVTDVAADTSVTGANIAANTNAAYTKIRRIASVYRSGGANVLISQLGDEFLLKTPVRDITASNPGNSAVTATLASIPTGVQVMAKFDALVFDGDSSATNKGVLFTSLDQTDTAASASLMSLGSGVVGGAGADYRDGGGTFHIRTNTSAQIRYRCFNSDANLNVSIHTHGWLDRRGRDE